MVSTRRHYCPSCGAGLVSEPISAPLKCKNCNWHLVSLAEWKKLPPFNQGYVLYMQAAWPRSELKRVKNPYPKNSPKWKKFEEGESRAVLNAQDSEE